MFSTEFICCTIDELESAVQRHISTDAALRIEVAKLVADKCGDASMTKLIDILLIDNPDLE